MPIHLAPVSRRQFLTRSAVAIGLLAFGKPAWALPGSRDPHHWALLADTHIAAATERVARGTNMTDNLMSVVREIIEKKKSPGGVLINGDCALSSGKAEDYQTFARLIQPLREAKLPLHCTLGNHDNRENFLAGLIAGRSAAGATFNKQVSVIETPRANWFLMDSLDQVNVTPGLIGEWQRQWLARELDERSNKPAIVVAHHNLGGMKDKEEMLEVLRPRRQVKAYIYGHTHTWDVSEDPSGIHLINLPPTAYIFKETDPNGWVEANVERRGLELKLHCMNRQHKAHGEKHELKWRKA